MSHEADSSSKDIPVSVLVVPMSECHKSLHILSNYMDSFHALLIIIARVEGVEW